eukprot:s2701_g6.t1
MDPSGSLRRDAAMLTCMPAACSDVVVSQWLAPSFIHSGTLEGILKLQKSYLGYSCQGAGHVSLHPRHAFPAASDRAFREEEWQAAAVAHVVPAARTPRGPSLWALGALRHVAAAAAETAAAKRW